MWIIIRSPKQAFILSNDDIKSSNKASFLVVSIKNICTSVDYQSDDLFDMRKALF